MSSNGVDGSADAGDKDVWECPTCGDEFDSYRGVSVHHVRKHPDKLEDRFWYSVDIRSEEECWEWKGTVAHDGYGNISIDDSPQRAHRIAYKLHNGEIDGEVVCHHCDNRSCCNPNHLFAGTQSDNIKDAFEKGRISTRGENSRRNKLSKSDVVEIKRRLKGEETHREISNDFGVSPSTVSHISIGSRWGHVEID